MKNSINIKNRKAKYDYHILDKYVSGIVLSGNEIKSVRQSKASLNNFTQGIYFDFKKFNVKVSLISPGFIKTQLTDKNEFPMPFLKSAEFAADAIFKGLIKNKFEVCLLS